MSGSLSPTTARFVVSEKPLTAADVEARWGPYRQSLVPARQKFEAHDVSDEARDEKGRWTHGGEYAPSHYSDAQTRSLERFSQSSYVDVNNTLRGVPVPAEYQTGRAAEITADMDAAFKTAAPLTHEIVAYRGLGLPPGFTPRVGASFTDRGFASTSTDPKVAAEFEPHGGGHRTGEPARITIVIPAGTRAINMEDVIGHQESLQGLRPEQELVLDRDSRFVVTSVGGGNGLPYEITVEHHRGAR